MPEDRGAIKNRFGTGKGVQPLSPKQQDMKHHEAMKTSEMHSK